MPPTVRRHGPCRARPAPMDALRRAAADQGQRACARGLRHRPGRALSPPVPGRRCGVNCPEGQFNITGCCTHARRSVRQAHSRRACAQPPLCLAPTPRLPRGQLGTARHAPRQRHVRSRLRRHRRHRSQALRAERGGHPRPPGQSATAGSCRWRVTPCPPRLPGLPSAPARRGLPEQPNAASHAVQAARVALHRKGQRLEARARQGQALRARCARP